MEFLIFSDSHGRPDGMRIALERQPVRPAAVIHLGDGAKDLNELDRKGIPVWSVRGNCDVFSFGLPEFCPDEYLTTLGGHLALLTHGAIYGVKGGLGALISSAAQKNAEIVLFGHTHRTYYEVIPAGTRAGETVLQRSMHLFNPGSVGMDSGEGRSFGILTVQGESLLFSHGTV